MADMDSRHYELQGRIDKLETQKSKLLHELDEIEEQYGKTDKLYKKYLPLIVDSVADSDSMFLKASVFQKFQKMIKSMNHFLNVQILLYIRQNPMEEIQCNL